MKFDAQIEKLIILYIFDKMEVAMKEEFIVDIISNENNWLDYITCKNSIEDLVKSGLLINTSAKSVTPRYTITSDSREGLAHFYTNIPMSTREEINEYIKTHRLYFRKKQDYFSNYYRNSDGTYTVNVKIEGPTKEPLMDLKIQVQNITKAKWIHKNWSEKASLMYGHIIEDLIDPPQD